MHTFLNGKNMEDFITGIIAWFVIIAIITMVYRLIKYKSLSDFQLERLCYGL